MDRQIIKGNWSCDKKIDGQVIDRQITWQKVPLFKRTSNILLCMVLVNIKAKRSSNYSKMHPEKYLLIDLKLSNEDFVENNFHVREYN